MTDLHATELQAVSISLMMWHQVIVVKESYPEHCGVHAHTHEEDANKAHHLVGGKNNNKKKVEKRQVTKQFHH